MKLDRPKIPIPYCWVRKFRNIIREKLGSQDENMPWDKPNPEISDMEEPYYMFGKKKHRYFRFSEHDPCMKCGYWSDTRVMAHVFYDTELTDKNRITICENCYETGEE